MLTHNQFAAMAYAALSLAHRPETSIEAVDRYDAWNLVNSAAKFKLGSQQKTEDQFMKDFREPIWTVLLQHGRSNNAKHAREDAVHISKATFITEILQNKPVNLEHVTKVFKIYLKHTSIKHGPIESWENLMRLQAVTSYFMLL